MTKIQFYSRKSVSGAKAPVDSERDLSRHRRGKLVLVSFVICV